MKKLGKLSINQSKLLENEELVNLRGGQYSYSACCRCMDSNDNVIGTVVSLDEEDCKTNCDALYSSGLEYVIWNC